MAAIFGVVIAGSFVEMGISRILPFVKRLITPLVTGIVVLMIGLTHQGRPDQHGWRLLGDVQRHLRQRRTCCCPAWCWASSWCSIASRWYGCAVAPSSSPWPSATRWPLPRPPGLHRHAPGRAVPGTDPAALRPGLLLAAVHPDAGDHLVTSRKPSATSPPPARCRSSRWKARCGCSGSRAACWSTAPTRSLAGIFNTFSSVFAQNKWVIQLTGVASRYVGLWIAAMLVLLGLFPSVAGSSRRCRNRYWAARRW